MTTEKLIDKIRKLLALAGSPNEHEAASAAAKAHGKRLGRQPGQRPKSDRLALKVLTLIATGRSYRLIGRELGLSKNTISAIITRSRSLISNTP
jgi:DNA-binding NarL/FixJ family response regulator